MQTQISHTKQKYKITASKEQLEDIGIDYPISGSTGTEVAIYGNWVVLDIEDEIQLDFPINYLEKL